MTADRWWVCLGARWLARLEAVSNIIRLWMLTMTGLSTALIGLKDYGYGQFALPLITVTVGALVAGTYYYSEGGVFNQKNRDVADLGANYAGPGMLIDDTLIASGMFAAIHGREPTEEEREAMRRTVRKEWDQYREGAELDPEPDDPSDNLKIANDD